MTAKWRGAYSAVLRERDRSKMMMRCDDAERTIMERYREILAAFGDDPKEREALSNALHNLGVVRKELRDRKAKAASAAHR